jgi:hypothetical protein
LLRFGLLILGFICVAGAIYLYKPTSSLITGPLNVAKGAVKGIAEAGAAGAAAGGAA